MHFVEPVAEEPDKNDKDGNKDGRDGNNGSGIAGDDNNGSRAHLGGLT